MYIININLNTKLKQEEKLKSYLNVSIFIELARKRDHFTKISVRKKDFFSVLNAILSEKFEVKSHY